VEQRWFTFRDGSHSFRNRIRYRLNAFLPLNARSIGPGTVFLSLFDEIFLNPKGPVFERNRLYAGLGYQASAHWVVQAGWVNQTNYNPAKFEQGVFYAPDLFGQKQPRAHAYLPAQPPQGHPPRKPPLPVRLTVFNSPEKSVVLFGMFAPTNPTFAGLADRKPLFPWTLPCLAPPAKPVGSFSSKPSTRGTRSAPWCATPANSTSNTPT